MVSAAISKLGYLGAEAHAKVLALQRGLEWEMLDSAGRAEMVSAAICELGHLGPEASQGFGLVKGTPLRFVESIGKRWVEQQGPQ